MTAASRSNSTGGRLPSATQRAASCRAHCAGCGRCFCSVDAFDHHRRGRFGLHSDDPEARRCVDPLDDPRFEPVSGVCQVSSDSLGATLWRLATAAQRVQQRFDSRRRKRATPSGDATSTISNSPRPSKAVIARSR